MKIPRLFWIAVFLVGGTVGFLVGASKSPLASAALPVLASLLAASATYLFSAELPYPSGSSRYRAAAIGYFALIIGFFPAFFVGTVMRLGPTEYVSLGPWTLDWGEPDAFTQLATDEQRRHYLMISAHLTALGIDDFHRRALLSGIVAEEPKTSDTKALFHDSDELRHFEAGMTKLADCADINDAKRRLFVAVAKTLAVDLQNDTSDPAHPNPADCPGDCKFRLLRASTAYWDPQQTVPTFASKCGLSAPETLAVLAAADRVATLSPLATFDTAITGSASTFAEKWKEPSGLFKATTSEATVGLPVEESLK